MKSYARCLAALAVAAPALACHSSDDSSTTVTTTFDIQANLFQIEGDLLVAEALETPGKDLNGDGDFFDGFLATVDLASGKQTLYPQSLMYGFGLGDGYVSFPASEYFGPDLNGDGDSVDGVVEVLDTRSGTTRDLGLALNPILNRQFLIQQGPLVAFVASESAQGADLDGDGLLTHDLVYTYEADLDRLTPQDLVTTLRPMLTNGWLLVAAQEQGLGDRNGDGDEDDQVLVAREVRTGVTRELRRAVQHWNFYEMFAAVDGDLLALGVPESLQGLDLNGDGDRYDSVVEIHDLATGHVVETGLPAVGLWAGGGLVAIYVSEIDPYSFAATDYDGNGNDFERVAFFYDWKSATLTNTRVPVDTYGVAAINPPVLSARRAAFVAYEPVDQNGDGDVNDHILQVFDARTGETEATGLTVWHEAGSLAIDDAAVACAKFEPNMDLRPTVLDLRSGAARELGASVWRLRLHERRLVYSVYESSEGADLNGDGDQEDVVQQVRDLATGRAVNTGLALLAVFEPTLALGDRWLAQQVPEAAQGRDLNGDGDLEDIVLGVMRLP